MREKEFVWERHNKAANKMYTRRNARTDTACRSILALKMLWYIYILIPTYIYFSFQPMKTRPTCEWNEKPRELHMAREDRVENALFSLFSSYIRTSSSACTALNCVRYLQSGGDTFFKRGKRHASIIRKLNCACRISHWHINEHLPN